MWLYTFVKLINCIMCCRSIKVVVKTTKTTTTKKMWPSFWYCRCCCCWVASVVSNSVRPHKWQPTRLHCPWASPGKNTGVGCHFLLQCMKVKNEIEVVQSCTTHRDPMDCSLPGSSIHGLFQARVLEWVVLILDILNIETEFEQALVFLWKPYVPPRLNVLFSKWLMTCAYLLWGGLRRLTKKQPICIATKQKFQVTLFCCHSVTKSCSTLWDPMDCSTPGSPVLHYLPEFAQIYVH